MTLHGDTPRRLARGTTPDLEPFDYDRFGPYRVFECLGAGGMASVHRATLEVDGVEHDIALKRMLPQLADDKKFVEDFIREAKLAAHLQHRNIVRTLELGRIGRTYYIAMELVHGASLQSIMMNSAGRPAPCGVVVSLMSELCDVLDYVANFVDDDAVRSAIVHRDLSLSNLLVADTGHLKVIDFGVAKATRGKYMTNTGMVRGKLGYLAPEALDGVPLDTRADIYSAGVVMWELLTGRRLFVGNNDDLAMMERIRRGGVAAPSVLNPRCPTELDDITLTALATDPAQRFQSASAMRSELEAVRRHCRDFTSADVARWKHALREPHPHEPTFEDSATPLSPEDLEELLDETALDQGTDDISIATLARHRDELDDVTAREVDVRIYFNHKDMP